MDCTLINTYNIAMTRLNQKNKKIEPDEDLDFNPVDLFDQSKAKPSREFKNALKAQMLKDFKNLNSNSHSITKENAGGFNIFSAQFVTYFSFGVSFVCLILIAVLSITNLNIVPSQNNAQLVYLGEEEKKEIAKNIVENNSQEFLVNLIQPQDSLGDAGHLAENLSNNNIQSTLTKNEQILQNNSITNPFENSSLINVTKLTSTSEVGEKYEKCYSEESVFEKLQSTNYTYYVNDSLVKSKTEVVDESNDIVEINLVEKEYSEQYITLYRGGRHAIRYEWSESGTNQDSQTPTSYPSSYPESENILLENVQHTLDISETVTIDGNEYYIAKTNSKLDCGDSKQDIVVKTYINQESYQIEIMETYLGNDKKENLISKFSSKAKVESLSKTQSDKLFSLSQRVIKLDEISNIKEKLAVVLDSEVLEQLDSIDKNDLLLDYYINSDDFYPSGGSKDKYIEYFDVENVLFSFAANTEVVVDVITPSSSDLPSKFVINETDKDSSKLYVKVDNYFVELMRTEFRVSFPVSVNDNDYTFNYRGFKYILKFENDVSQEMVPEFVTVESI